MSPRMLPIGVLLLAIQQTVAQGPSPTSNFSLSRTSQRPAASVTTPPCCFWVPMTAGLNMWWTSSLTATAATVITEYLQYNNTIIPNATTTIYNNISTSDFFASITTNLLPGNFVYDRTFVELTTVLSHYWGNSAMAYPTPFVEVHQIAYADGEIGTDAAGVATCTPAPPKGNPLDDFYYLSEGVVFAPETTPWTAPAGDIRAPTGVLDAWIAQTPDITSKIPWLRSCTSIQGSGEPSVHVPVTALTEHSQKTIRMTGPAPGQPVQPTSPPESPPESPPVGPPIATQRPPFFSNPFPVPNPPTNPQPTHQNPPVDSPGTPPQPTANPNAPNSGAPNPGAPAPNPSNPNPSNPNAPNPNAPNPNAPNPNAPNPNTPNPNIPNNPPPPPPTLPGPSLPIPILPAPNNPGVVLPGGPTLAPGITTTISNHEIIVPTNQPTNGVVLPGGATLAPGATTTISGTEVFVPTDRPSVVVIGGTSVPAPTNIVIIDGTTVPVPAPAPAPTVTNAPVSSIKIGNDVISITVLASTAGAGVGVVLPDGNTLLPGSTTTYLGETIGLSVGPSGTPIVQVIHSTSTEAVDLYTPKTLPLSPTGSGSNTGSGATKTTSGLPGAFTGAAAGKGRRIWGAGLVAMVGVVMLM